MKLRKEIENAIREAKEDRALAALAICALLDERLNLAALGWLDDDPLLLQTLKKPQPSPIRVLSAA
ncbi:hypothetical protein ACNFBT_11700 [Pseudomonas sp. NY15181]|uniref:hypothetical protein n=1 Tax=unclassified Pseudomonas TaxID=196821 RepID=UPI00126420FE|nr:hypothetical protein [Pseudomonas sp. SCB32]